MPLRLSRPKPSHVVAVLQNVPLFAGLSRKELQQVAGFVHEVEIPAGKRLATMGETGREFFVIVGGQALVRTRWRRTARLGPGG